jgi:hypothetical protein
MGDGPREDKPDIEFHVPKVGRRSLEAITARLQEMQRELDERAPVDPNADDEPGAGPDPPGS